MFKQISASRSVPPLFLIFVWHFSDLGISEIQQSDPERSVIQRIGVQRRWSDFVLYRGTGYFVEVPDDPSASPADQFRQIFQQLTASLSQIGSGADQLLRVEVILPEPQDLQEFNRQWDEWVPEGHAPSRVCIHAQLVNPDYRVELVVTAAVPMKDS